jgi:hypothetical protein
MPHGVCRLSSGPACWSQTTRSTPQRHFRGNGHPGVVGGGLGGGEKNKRKRVLHRCRAPRPGSAVLSTTTVATAPLSALFLKFAYSTRHCSLYPSSPPFSNLYVSSSQRWWRRRRRRRRRRRLRLRPSPARPHGRRQGRRWIHRGGGRCFQPQGRIRVERRRRLFLEQPPWRWWLLLVAAVAARHGPGQWSSAVQH